MSSNPRKFSEKIAIHQRKLMEEQNAFKQIMGEVQQVKATPSMGEQPSYSQVQGGLSLPSWSPFRGGSLPNVYQLAQGQQPSDLQSLIDAGYNVQPSSSYVGMVGYVNPHGVIHPSRGRSPGAVSHYHPYSPRGYSGHSPNRSPVHMPSDQQLSNVGMYGPGAVYSGYLLPPAESNWRRASSDPCVHASVMHPNMPGSPILAHNGSPTHTPPTRSPPGVSISPELVIPMQNGGQMRPTSPGGHIPNINIYTSDPHHGPHVAISSTAGSLPDLAMSQPVDQDSQGHMSYHHLHNMGEQGSAILTRTIQQSPQQQQQYSQYSAVGYQQMNSSPQQNYDKASNPGSPVGPGDSPVMSPQQPCSPGSAAAYYVLQSQLQNFNMSADSRMSNARHAGYGAVSAYQTESGMMNMSSYLPQYSSAIQSHSQGSQMTPPSYAESAQHCQQMQYAKHQPVSPQGSQIPNIVLTNFDDNTRSPYDPSSEFADCEALKMGLDLSDLSELQLDASQDLSIDAATEDALRLDRA